MADGLAGELLARLEEETATDDFVGRAAPFMAEVARLVEASQARGVHLPPDPFRGDGPEQEIDPLLYYRMFWRMFDKSPAARSRASPSLTPLLAKRLFRHCGDGVIFHHNVLFSDGRNISLGDGVN